MKILLLNQCFYPDYVATAQYLTDLALGLSEAGHEVTVVASSRGYDNPQNRYPVKETWRGIRIRRIWTTSLGKKAKWRRFVDFGVFWFNAFFTLLCLPRFDVTVCLTSPPLISTLGTLMAWMKGGAVVPWIMDLNPDEAVAAGWLKEGGVSERILSTLQRWSFHRAARIIVLDRFMAQRLMAKGVPEKVIHTDAPWSHDDTLQWDAVARAKFRANHGLTDKFVVMYSGNHSPCHPLDTVLESALTLARDDRVAFLFVGGGSEFIKVKAFAKERGLTNITCLPYQPLDTLSASLSSADLHLVVMGPPFIGMIHPCKVYNLLALGLPFLAIGPQESHLTDLAARLPDRRYARLADFGDQEQLNRAILQAADEGHLPPAEASQRLAADFSQRLLRRRLIDVITAVGS